MSSVLYTSLIALDEDRGVVALRSSIPSGSVSLRRRPQPWRCLGHFDGVGGGLLDHPESRPSAPRCRGKRCDSPRCRAPRGPHLSAGPGSRPSPRSDDQIGEVLGIEESALQAHGELASRDSMLPAGSSTLPLRKAVSMSVVVSPRAARPCGQARCASRNSARRRPAPAPPRQASRSGRPGSARHSP